MNVEVTDTVFRACSAGGAGGGVAALDGAAVALADSAALDCAGGADGTGNEVRGGGVYVAGADTVASLRNFSAIGCSLPEENGKGGGVNVDGGASLTVDGLLVADCVSFFAGGVFVGTGCAPAIANAVVRDNARRTAPVSAPSRTPRRPCANPPCSGTSRRSGAAACSRTRSPR